MPTIYSEGYSAIWEMWAYVNVGALIEMTMALKKIYIDTAREAGLKPGPEHFGYQVRALVADTDERAQELGQAFMWTVDHRRRGPREHSDPPGYQSRTAQALGMSLPIAPGQKMTYQKQQELNSIIVGNPETVTRKLATTIEHLNPGYLILNGIDGPIPHSDVMRSIELLGKEVIPALHEIKLQPYE